MSAEMHNAVDALARSLDLVRFGQIRLDEAFIGLEVGRCFQVGEHELRVNRLEQLAQVRADTTGRSGDETALHPGGLLSSLTATQGMLGEREAGRHGLPCAPAIEP